MDKSFTIKSSNNLQLILVVVFIFILTFIITKDILILITSLIFSISLVLLIGNKTIRFQNDCIECFYSTSPFKRRIIVFYKEIFFVEIYNPYNTCSLIIHYVDGEKNKKIKISIENNLERLDELIVFLKKKGITNFDLKNFK